MPTARSSSSSVLLAFALAVLSGFAAAGAGIGAFEGDSGVGVLPLRGSVAYEAATGSYTVTGGGANMWSTNDALHFVWKRVSGDIDLAADIRFLGDGGDPHRKACLLVRQSLDPDSAYADAVVHGDGLTSLQYRETRNHRTYEVQSGATAPGRLRIEKRGGYVSMSIGGAGEPLRPSGAFVRLELQNPFFVGIGVCAHDPGRLERAVFSQVELTTGPRSVGGGRRLSSIETVPLASKDRRVVHMGPTLLQAPTWSPDGSHLLFSGEGRVYRVPATGGPPTAVDTGPVWRCSGHHGYAPDGARIAITQRSIEDGRFRIYTVPAGGGLPNLITPRGPSFFQSWSPDGSTLLLSGTRRGRPGLFTIPATGGAETIITRGDGRVGAPDYAPDGRWIYYHSDASGSLQIWRIRPNGTQAERVTRDDQLNVFPHPSPDGKWLVFLSAKPKSRPLERNQDVTLRLLALETGALQTLAKFYGGPGSIPAPPWSRDSRRVAFVSYQPVP